MKIRMTGKCCIRDNCRSRMKDLTAFYFSIAIGHIAANSRACPLKISTDGAS